MCMNSMIEVRDVSVRFRMANDKINSLKEYMIQKLRGQLKYNECIRIYFFQFFDKICQRLFIPRHDL